MLNEMLRLIFPPRCIFCKSLLSVGTTIEICSGCHTKIPFIHGNIVETAGEKLYKSHCDGIICACEYSGIIKEGLIKYKFFDKASYYRAFAKLLSNRIKNMTRNTKFDIIISVPLHKERERIRGYNQALLISKFVSRELGVAENSRVLRRIRNTQSQSLLNKEERHVNIRDAFSVSGACEISGKTILLIDDVLTTGSTVNECSRVLKEAGAKAVIAAVVASGKKFNYE